VHGDDEEVLDGPRRDDDSRHRLRELVERNPLATPRVLDALLAPLVRARIEPSSSTMCSASGSAPSSAADSSDFASVPSWTCIRSRTLGCRDA
jgi:hypothetical protein